jgi:hypothetical protein
MRALVALSLMTFIVSAAGQDNPYVVQGSIGKVEKPKSDGTGPETLELDRWVGEKFILLPQPANLREYGSSLSSRACLTMRGSGRFLP